MSESVGWGFGDLRKAESWVPASERESRDSELGETRQIVRYGRRVLVGLRADDVKAVSIERLCLYLLMSKNLWLKGNKVSYLNQFRVFRFPMSISHIRISGYVTVSSNSSSAIKFNFWLILLKKAWAPLSQPTMGKIVLQLSFYKDGFGIR